MGRRFDPDRAHTAKCQRNIYYWYGGSVIPGSVLKRISAGLLIVGPLTTLMITPWWNFDPINLGKNLVLSSISFLGIGLLAPYSRIISNNFGKYLTWTLCLFVAFLFAPLSFTEAPLAQQIWGQFGRATGIVTYLSLLFILLQVSLIKDKTFYKRLVHGLISTQAILTLYCLLQIAKKDPIGWSAYATFGTLGNVNFLSGFMGIAVVASIGLAFSLPRKKLAFRGFLLALSIMDIYIVATTDSIQGLVALGVGISALVWFRLLSSGKKWHLWSYSALVFIGMANLVAAIFNAGPLKSLIYQVTITYRADYMHAALAMIWKHPLTGIGIDSYDDWYRQERGIISAYRTGLNRTANSAHNIALDLGVGGGLPLLLCYLALILIVGLSILKVIRSGGVHDPYFCSLAAAWIAYQVQASVSINQIGVGVWGWILSGALIGYVSATESAQTKTAQTQIVKKKKMTSSKSPNTPPPQAVLFSVLTLAIGFALSFTPLKIDMDFRKAYANRNADKIIEVTSNSATNSFLLSQGLNVLLSNNLTTQAKILNDRITSRYPRNLYGWNSRLNLPGVSAEEQALALGKVKKLDPASALCLEPNFETVIRSRLTALPPNKQFELAKGWGMLPERTQNANSFSLTDIEAGSLDTKIKSFCLG